MESKFKDTKLLDSFEDNDGNSFTRVAYVNSDKSDRFNAIKLVEPGLYHTVWFDEDDTIYNHTPRRKPDYYGPGGKYYEEFNYHLRDGSVKE